MSKQAFTIEGDFEMGRIRQHFKVEIAAADEDTAREYTLTNLGSRHGVSRRQISIGSITPLAAGDVTNPIVARQIQG